MIGSNMAQCAAMMRLTPNLCLYDTYAPGLEGVAEELAHCGFKGMNITWTTDVKEAFTDAKYMVSTGGAPRKAGMTREDLLRGNAGIAEQLGKDIKTYCPDLEHLVVIFNPADITGLVALLYSGLKPSQVTTLAALDSTRLRSELSKFFKIAADRIKNPNENADDQHAGEDDERIVDHLALGGPYDLFQLTLHFAEPTADSLPGTHKEVFLFCFCHDFTLSAMYESLPYFVSL